MTATPLNPVADEPETLGDAGRSTHVFLGLCVAATLSFIAWAAIGTLDIVSLASGEVIPSSQVKSIQHLEGGIVRDISVREGDKVAKDQALIVLEPTQSGADVGELNVRLASLTAEIARLEAEVAGKEEPTFPPALKTEQPRLVEQSLARFESRRKAYQSRFAGQREAVVQREQEIREISARIRNQQENLTLLQEQIAISEELLKEDLTNRYNHLDLLKEASRLRGGIEQDTAALSRAGSALKETQAALGGIANAFVEDAANELEDARLNFNELSQRAGKFQDSLERTVLRSPVDGVVKSLYVSTVGGVLRPGQTALDIVPGSDRLVIEARLAPQDIGYVAAGQYALIKLASADGQRFGGIDGTVTNVSPDTLETQEGTPFYKVRIETESDRFRRGELQYRLFPGMQVTASIRTGERTVLEYLTGPLLYSMSGAMSER